MDQFANRIAEETSKSHLQKTPSSRQWPSPLVGRFKGNLILIFSILITCFAGTIAEIQMEFTSNATTNVPLKETLNLTCKFKLVKDDIENILFTLGATELYDYRSNKSITVLQHGYSLSTASNVDSVFWITLRNSFCHEPSREKKYECSVHDAFRKVSQRNVGVSYQGPNLDVIVDGITIKNNGSAYSVTLGHNRINNDIQIRIVAKNFITTPPNMTLSYENEILPSDITPTENDYCIFATELKATHNFTESGMYTFNYSGPPNSVTIQVTVEGRRSRVRYELGRGPIFGIILLVVLVLIVLLSIWWFVCSKRKEENKECVRMCFNRIFCHNDSNHGAYDLREIPNI